MSFSGRSEKCDDCGTDLMTIAYEEDDGSTTEKLVCPKCDEGLGKPMKGQIKFDGKNCPKCGHSLRSVKVTTRGIKAQFYCKNCGRIFSMV